MQSTEYTGFFAEFYDLLHTGCTDAKIYPLLLEPYGQNVLELGSGTGRISIPLANAGYHVTGLEYSDEMIELMRQKAYPVKRLRVVQGDARDFQLNETFDIILLTCNFINHFPNAQDVVNILTRCKHHLKENGIVIIDCSAPDTGAMCKSCGVEEVLEFKTARGTVIRDYFLPRYDFLNQLETDDIRLEEYEGDTLLRSAQAHETLTWFYPREVRLMIHSAGLEIFLESGRLWPKEPVPIGPDFSEMIFFCRKRA